MQPYHSKISTCGCISSHHITFPSQTLSDFGIVNIACKVGVSKTYVFSFVVFVLIIKLKQNT